MHERIACICVDRGGIPFEICALESDENTCLNLMYDAFSPKGISQGLPPVEDNLRRNWVEDLCRSGDNFIAFRGEKAVGHAGLIVDRARNDTEYLIFINQNHRNLGLGTELTHMAVRRARELNLDRIWLSVEKFNFAAIKLYKKFGFRFGDDSGGERLMILDLHRDKDGD